jgi:hypothetical protein
VRNPIPAAPTRLGFEIVNERLKAFSVPGGFPYPRRYPSDECRFHNSAGLRAEVLEIPEVA